MWAVPITYFPFSQQLSLKEPTCTSDSIGFIPFPMCSPFCRLNMPYEWHRSTSHAHAQEIRNHTQKNYGPGTGQARHVRMSRVTKQHMVFKNCKVYKGKIPHTFRAILWTVWKLLFLVHSSRKSMQVDLNILPTVNCAVKNSQPGQGPKLHRRLPSVNSLCKSRVACCGKRTNKKLFNSAAKRGGDEGWDP